MGRIFQPARMPGAGAASPGLQQMAYTTGQTFKKGAVVVFVAAGTVSESGADPTGAIAGVASEGAGTHPGFDPANELQLLQVTGKLQEVGVYRVTPDTIFSGRAISGGTDPVTPVLADHMGNEYGVAKTAAGEWVVDIAETTAKVVRIVDIDIDNKIFFFVFIQGVIGVAP